MPCHNLERSFWLLCLCGSVGGPVPSKPSVVVSSPPLDPCDKLMDPANISIIYSLLPAGGISLAAGAGTDKWNVSVALGRWNRSRAFYKNKKKSRRGHLFLFQRNNYRTGCPLRPQRSWRRTNMWNSSVVCKLVDAAVLTHRSTIDSCVKIFMCCS